MNKRRLLYNMLMLIGCLILSTSAKADSYTIKVGDLIVYNNKTYKVAGENLITNPNFDDNFTGWTAGDGTALSSENFSIENDGPNGSACLKAKKNGGSGKPQTLRTGWEITSGKTYIFYCWAKRTEDAMKSNTQYSKILQNSKIDHNGGTEITKINYQADTWVKTQVVFTSNNSYLVANFAWLNSGTSFDCFYLGEVEEVDELTDSKEQYYKSKETASKALSDYDIITGKEKADLTSAINASVEETVDAYKAAKTNIDNALIAFTSALSSYTTYQKQIDEMVATAKALGVDDADSYKLTITETTTAAELQEKLNAVKVAQYNKVESLGYSEVTSPAGLTFSGWDNANQFGNTDYRNVWDGTGKGTNTKVVYYEKSNGYNDSDWTIAPTKTVNLPAGKYVAKLACRTSTNATGTVTVKEGENTLSSATFPIKNDNGFGINTSGATSFDESDNFANSGKGYGWEWRFLPFELTEDADVTFTIDLAVVGNHQYPGFTALDLYTTVKDITLDETSSNTIESGFANITLKRKLTADVWNSLVLPFSMTKDQVKSVFGYNGNEDKGTKVATFSDATLTENNYTLKFDLKKNGNAVITANTPCLIRPKTTASEYTVEGVRMEPSTNNLTVEHNGVSFIGSYDNAGLEITKNDYFLASDNKMYRAAGTETMKGFRAVFRVAQDETQEAKTLSVSFDDETTGITTVKANNTKSTAIYNIAGQLVKEASSTEGLQKGVYIVNGKKVIIK